ncbi:hypothetical protein VTN77DRAFT_5113 [Rasamsonia byssochlamydoides]|uniref:uncharacterized protein n=1 Tax=Rasamsonia byssochlamydoides TaxID=89139 RepID=UPI003742C744
MPTASNLNIPPSPNIVQVSIIDTTASIEVPADRFLAPRVDGLERMNCNAFAFLVENPRSGRRVVFDLGARKDWENLAKPVYERISRTFKVSVEKDVAEILTENGVPLESVDSIIWSHWHWDHTGDPSTFPPSTSLVVGPGMPAAKLPAYPTNPSSTLLESDFRGRQLVEITRSQFTLKIGDFGAYDFFGDGSFYLLDVPGHAVGHVCGLARTTAAGNSSSDGDTFILMGGDSCHHGGQIRPSQYLPLPEQIQLHPDESSHSTTCPGALFEKIHPEPENYSTKPFYRIRVWDDGQSVADDPATAQQSIHSLQPFDAAENIFFVFAHDKTLADVVDTFPAKANGWKEAGWKERGRWRFLRHWKVDS